MAFSHRPKRETASKDDLQVRPLVRIIAVSNKRRPVLRHVWQSRAPDETCFVDLAAFGLILQECAVGPMQGADAGSRRAPVCSQSAPIFRLM
jgi:hypothetical protein